MKDPLILAIDFGTQSVRASLFNKKGETVDLVKKAYEPCYLSPKPGYAEQDPFYYYKRMCEATKELAAKNNDLINDVLGITMCFFRDSVVFMDKDNNVLRPAILWLDERRAQGKFKLPLSSRAIFRLIGMKETIDLNLKRSMSQWVRESEPEIWSKTDKFMMISTFIAMQLTGEYIDSPCTQAGHIPIDFKNREFYKKDTHLTGQTFGVKRAQLCRLVPQGQPLGCISEKAAMDTGLPAGMKIFSSGSDKSAETLGLGVVDERTAAISYGTACTIEIPIKKFKNAEPFLPSYPDILPNRYDMDIQVYRGYWMLNWFSSQFGTSEKIESILQNTSAVEVFNKEMLKIEPGCEGLVLQPYWGSGLSRPLAKGAIVGFNDVHTKVHMYRAIIEGIAYCLREGCELLEKKRLHHKIEKIRISGGGSQSDAICQITADIFGLPVSKIQTYECSSLGAAIAGFIFAGEFKDEIEATKAMVHQSVEFYPNEENHKKYDFLFNNVYTKMYPKLRYIYKDLNKYKKINS